MSQNETDRVRVRYAHLVRLWAKLPGFLIGDVDAVAADGYRALMRGKVIKVPGAVNLAGTVAGRATPKWLLRRISGTLLRKAL